MPQLHLEEWVRFCQTTFPDKSVPPYPAQKSELPFTYQLALDEWNEGKLSQNLFASKTTGAGLPADVALRLQQNALLATDADALRQAGLTFYANQCDEAARRTDDAALAKEARLSAERAAQVEQAQKEWAALPLGHPAKAPSPESVQRTKESWGITGRASWE